MANGVLVGLSNVLLALTLAMTVTTVSGCENGDITPQLDDPARDRDRPTPEPDPQPDPEPQPDPDPEPDLCAEATNKFIPGGASAVYYGTRQPTHVPLTGPQVLAVVGIGFGDPASANCSGTLITDDIVLTAQHCTEGEPGTSMYAIFGVDDENPVLSIATIEKREHPDHDMALLRLQRSPIGELDVVPIPVDRGTLSNADIGSTFEQAGYGRTELGYSDGRFFVAEVLDGFENGPRDLVVDGQGQQGVCFGDSGGPSMRITDEGVRVAGALSWGDPSCVGRDRYSRVDFALDWIEEWTGPTPGGDQPVPCGSVSEVGRCDVDRVSRCEGGELVTEQCGGATACGFDEGLGAYGCLDPALDPCGGISNFGRCAAGVLEWCDAGTLTTRDCGSCGETCGLVDNAFGFACLPSGFEPVPTVPTDGDACGDIDYQGVCEGERAIWCDDDTGLIETRDCAAQSQTCGFVNDSLGFFCQDAPAADPCEGLDYLGECQGQTARWCQNGELRTRDCAAQGDTCGFVDDDTGYFCQ